MEKLLIISQVQITDDVNPNGGHTVLLKFQNEDATFATNEMELRSRYSWLKKVHICNFNYALVGKIYKLHITDIEMKIAELFFTILSQSKTACTNNQISKRDFEIIERIVNTIANPVMEVLRQELINCKSIDMFELSFSQQS